MSEDAVPCGNCGADVKVAQHNNDSCYNPEGFCKSCGWMVIAAWGDNFQLYAADTVPPHLTGNIPIAFLNDPQGYVDRYLAAHMERQEQALEVHHRRVTALARDHEERMAEEERAKEEKLQQVNEWAKKMGVELAVSE